MPRRLAVSAIALLVAACASAPERPLPALALAGDVDLARFMGDWYVIAAIPTVFERHAFNPMDSYRIAPDGTIATTYSYNDGASDGPRRSMISTGFVVPGSGNAIWQQQYLWPFRADYRIAYLDANYAQVVVAREQRDYAWIMARTPTIADADLAHLTAFVAAQGYDASRLQRASQAAACSGGSRR